jgi:hypothetical protein
MWVYAQRTGNLYEPIGVIVAQGYSGNGTHKNQPNSQCVQMHGPCPRGFYSIQPPNDTPAHGPYVMWLVPDRTNDMCGRSGFGIHGDSLEHPGYASDGCIILPRPIREGIWQSGDHILQVISGLAEVNLSDD